MAIAIQTNGHHVAHRPPWMRPRPPRHDTLLAALMLVLVIVGFATLVLSAPMFTVTVPRSLVGVTRRSVETRPRDGSVPVARAAPDIGTEELAPEVPSSVTESASAEVDRSAPSLAVGGRARVVNTGGVGVILHAAPRAGSRRPAGLLEGTTVSILELAGGEWVRVQSDSKLAGWVPTAFLTPLE